MFERLHLHTFALGLIPLLGCAPVDLDSRIANLEAEEARRQAKLDALAHQITAAELRAEYAKKLVQYHECKATSAAIGAEVMLRRANCVQELAAHTECVANNEKDASRATAAGCIGGLALAVLTGGAAVPLAAAGCAGGAVIGQATKTKCGDIPRCASQLNNMHRVVLADRGLAAVPTCIEPAEPEIPEAPKIARVPQRPEPAEARETAVAAPTPPPPVERRTVCTDQRIAWVEFIVPARRPDGRAWDPRDGNPDLRYAIYIEGQKRYESQVYETLKWHHEPPADIRVAPQQQLSVQLLDSDQQSSETIAVFRSITPADTTDALHVDEGGATAKIKLECVDE